MILWKGNQLAKIKLANSPGKPKSENLLQVKTFASGGLHMYECNYTYSTNAHRPRPQTSACLPTPSFITISGATIIEKPYKICLYVTQHILY